MSVVRSVSGIHCVDIILSTQMDRSDLQMNNKYMKCGHNSISTNGSLRPIDE